ncbi:hypothetical protein [Hyphomonas sp.]|uniref:hypothetical protein n=1 Tax=Hyphomonas sp. TaxID=87 RepID=UPI000A883BCA|nr:hypothetical protein [Hyphomonas sp.]
MIRGFTFERALSWPFTAPHVASFPWIFGLAYALVFMAVSGAVVLLAADDFTALFAAMEAVEGSTNPDAGFDILFGGLARLIPWMVLSGLASWMIWAMFETASQRRYIRGEAFSLGFGADEARMMVVGLLWGLIGFALIAVPILLIMWSALAAVFAGAEGMTDAEVGERILGPMFGAMGLSVLVFPVYVFLATRLAPCFGLTVRERKIRFFDAWNVSRGRFWPILGAYVILAIAGSILGQVITGIAQMIIMPATMDLANAADQGADMRGLILSPAFLVPMGAYLFIVLYVQGVLQHAVGGPAAFAVRHDPRGGIEEESQIEAFN